MDDTSHVKEWLTGIHGMVWIYSTYLSTHPVDAPLSVPRSQCLILPIGRIHCYSTFNLPKNHTLIVQGPKKICPTSSSTAISGSENLKRQIRVFWGQPLARKSSYKKKRSKNEVHHCSPYCQSPLHTGGANRSPAKQGCIILSTSSTAKQWSLFVRA